MLDRIVAQVGVELGRARLFVAELELAALHLERHHAARRVRLQALRLDPELVEGAR